MNIWTTKKVTKMMTATRMTYMAYLFLVKKTTCIMVRQCQCKTYHQCCGMTSTIVHQRNKCLQH
eukprot:12700582-Prorocentrum_lima.AAC.1